MTEPQDNDPEEPAENKPLVDIGAVEVALALAAISFVVVEFLAPLLAPGTARFELGFAIMAFVTSSAAAVILYLVYLYEWVKRVLEEKRPRNVRLILAFSAHALLGLALIALVSAFLIAG